MALDDDDKKEIAKIFNQGFTAREERSEKRVAEIVAATLKTHTEAQEEAARIRAAEEADKAKTVKAEDGEKVTLTKRVKEMEEKLKAAEEGERREKVNAAFRSTWSGAKFQPDLADEHMALLRTQDRLMLDENGAVRVKDPKKSKHETQPTLEEYIGELAKSERGKVYQAPTGTPGQGASAVSGGQRQAGEKMSPQEANEAIFGIRIG